MDRAEALDNALAQIESNFDTEYRKRPFGAPTQKVAVFKNPETHVNFRLYFGHGTFDDWCVFLRVVADGHEVTTELGYEKVPTDAWYFGVLNDWAEYLVPDFIYYDFIKIYETVAEGPAHYSVTAPTINLIERLSFSYPDYDQACVIWTILYMGMIAEENKTGKILGKRIKRLGVYQVLIERQTPVHAANFSRGRSTLELAPYCNERGF
jgi:hypothetical protein